MSKWIDDTVPVPAVNASFLEGPRSRLGRGLRWASRLVGQVRRQYLSRLRPAYVARMRLARQGECRRCGNCCDLTFHCPMLSKEGPCKHYEWRNVTCRDFPLDALDLRLTRVPCGHHFEPER